MLKNKKILIVIAIVIILAGIYRFFAKYINYGLQYGENISIEMYLETEFEEDDIKAIANETFGKNTIQEIDDIKGYLLITAKDFSEENLKDFTTKLNEKYNLEISTDDLMITYNPSISLKDIVSIYIIPVVISTIIILIYLYIRYKELGLLKIVIDTIIAIFGSQILYINFVLAFGIKVSQLFMPIAMLVLACSTIILVEIFNKNYNSKKEQK